MATDNCQQVEHKLSEEKAKDFQVQAIAKHKEGKTEEEIKETLKNECVAIYCSQIVKCFGNSETEIKKIPLSNKVRRILSPRSA